MRDQGCKPEADAVPAVLNRTASTVPKIGRARGGPDFCGNTDNNMIALRPWLGTARSFSMISRFRMNQSIFQCPDLPPFFSTSRMASMTMPRSTALHMS